MRSLEEAFCPNCEWTGDATGITSCPVCGSNLSNLSEPFEKEELGAGEPEMYPTEVLSKIRESGDDDNIE